MRLLIQRVRKASVTIQERLHSQIEHGLLIFVGIEASDTQEDIDWLAGKVTRLRIFNDQNGVMNLDVMQVDGSILVVSQFTLHASTNKGNRPSYIHAAGEGIAIPLYQQFISKLSLLCGKNIATGVFGADMQVELINDGPVTIWIDSKNRG